MTLPSHLLLGVPVWCCLSSLEEYTCGVPGCLRKGETQGYRHRVRHRDGVVSASVTQHPGGDNTETERGGGALSPSA